eukprot:95609_1
MTEKKVTRHQCPVCKDIIYNNVTTFHDHLSKICAQTLFSKYPGLKTEQFNALWYKLQDMVKETIIMPSGQKGVSATIKAAHQAPPPSRYYRRAMDLEDLDQSISYLQKQEKARERNRIQQRKRRRFEMEQEISNELNHDEFTLSMPKLDDAPRSKKRRLLYHNTSDIRPPKRVNIDPTVSMPLFQHKIRQTRRKYHNVSFHDFANEEAVDQHPAIIHTQKALDRYLLHCEMLRKCFNGDLFVKIANKYEDVHGANYATIMKSTLNEIKIWQDFEEIHKEETVEKEEFLSSWDAIQHQTDPHHLDKLLERESLCGFYAKLDDQMETDAKK